MDNQFIIILIIIIIAFAALLARCFQLHLKLKQQLTISNHFQGENEALLQQIALIKKDKPYSGLHLKEVKRAFEDLDKAVQELKTVCKQDQIKEEIESETINNKYQFPENIINHNNEISNIPKIRISLSSKARISEQNKNE